jgi:cyclic pyranopterin phosphate synthase
MLTDRFHRVVNYLRLSVTDRCNLRCRYCAPSTPNRLDRRQLLSLEEMGRLVRIGMDLGITKVRLTGGEPLVRKDITVLVEELCRDGRLKDISITTNGTLLNKYGRSLKAAGLTRLNISLDTLNAEKFHHLTRMDLFSTVWYGIMNALELGFAPIKINTVVMNGYNDDEIAALARLALDYPFFMRFIEYMPIGIDSGQNQGYFLPMSEVKKIIETQVGELTPVEHEDRDGPAQRYRLKGGLGEIGLIGSMSAHFCGTCNRIRLTAAGHLRPCLLSPAEVNIAGPLRNGASDEELAAIFMEVARMKKQEHQLTFNCTQTLDSQMVSIGG